MNYVSCAFVVVLASAWPGSIFAATDNVLLVPVYSIHLIKIVNLGILLVMLLRKSVSHQRRLNWFFGAVDVVLISSQTLIFERFFGTPGSILNNSVNTIALLTYFGTYWYKTWGGEDKDSES